MYQSYLHKVLSRCERKMKETHWWNFRNHSMHLIYLYFYSTEKKTTTHLIIFSSLWYCCVEKENSKWNSHRRKLCVIVQYVYIYIYICTTHYVCTCAHMPMDGSIIHDVLSEPVAPIVFFHFNRPPSAVVTRHVLRSMIVHLHRGFCSRSWRQFIQFMENWFAALSRTTHQPSKLLLWATSKNWLKPYSQE